jgi:hypothetical protein
MKARLLLGKVPQETGVESLAGDAAGGGIDADALEALDTLNSELDIEMSSLMSQLGMVRGEVRGGHFFFIDCTETCSHHLLALPREIKTRPHQSFHCLRKGCRRWRI